MDWKCYIITLAKILQSSLRPEVHPEMSDSIAGLGCQDSQYGRLVQGVVSPIPTVVRSATGVTILSDAKTVRPCKVNLLFLIPTRTYIKPPVCTLDILA